MVFQQLAPSAIVQGPAVSPPAHSLVVSAIPVTEPDDRWEAGFEFCPELCVEPAVWSPLCVGTPSYAGGLETKSVALTGGPGQPGGPCDPGGTIPYFPFIIESPVECGTRGFAEQDYVGRARRQVEAITPKALEGEFWTGAEVPDNPHLADGDAVTVIAGGPYDARRAVAALNQAIAECASGGRGMIHGTPEAITVLGGSELLAEDGGRLVTRVMRNIVVAGTGYPGTGPNGAAPAAGTSWLYATGMVQVRLSDIRVVPDTFAEALDRATNMVNYRGERTAAASWDTCCHFAVAVNL